MRCWRSLLAPAVDLSFDPPAPMDRVSSLSFVFVLSALLPALWNPFFTDCPSLWNASLVLSTNPPLDDWLDWDADCDLPASCCATALVPASASAQPMAMSVCFMEN